MKKLIVSILLFSFALLVGAQQYEYKINARTGKPDMVNNTSSFITASSLDNYIPKNFSNFVYSNIGYYRLYFTGLSGTNLVSSIDNRAYYQTNSTQIREMILSTGDASGILSISYNGNSSNQNVSPPTFIKCYNSIGNINKFLVDGFGNVFANSYSITSGNSVTYGLTATRTFNEQSVNNLQYRVNTVTITGGIITAWTQGTWTNH